jgi:hypothetical protein
VGKKPGRVVQYSFEFELKIGRRSNQTFQFFGVVSMLNPSPGQMINI